MMATTLVDDKGRHYLKVAPTKNGESSVNVYMLANSTMPTDQPATVVNRLSRAEKQAAEVARLTAEAEAEVAKRKAHYQNMRDIRAAKIASGELTPQGRKIPKLIPQDKQGNVLPEGHVPKFNLPLEEAAKGPQGPVKGSVRGPYAKKHASDVGVVSTSNELASQLKHRNPEEIASFLMDNLSARELIEVHGLLGKFFK